MKKRNLRFKDNTISVKYLEKITSSNKTEILDLIINSIDYIDNYGYLGFEKNEINELKLFLEDTIFTNYDELNLQIDINFVLSTIKKTLKELESNFTKQFSHIYILSSYDNFLIEMMQGTGGYATNQVIVLTINPKIKILESSIKHSIIHEFVNMRSLEVKEWCSILDQIVSDGIAEHFCEKRFNLKRKKWTEVLSKKDSVKLFLELKSDLLTYDENLSRDLFYGTGKFPLWAGYSIGYYLVEIFLLQNKQIK